MIRRLTAQDHDVCFELLKTKSAENLFIIGDIEAYGYEQDFQKLWGEFDEHGELIAVLLKYEQNYIPFALGAFDAEGFANIMCDDPNFNMMSGLQEITGKIEPYVTKQLKRKRPTYYAKCTKLQGGQGVDLSHVQQATPDDAEQLVEMLKAVPEFSESSITVERKRRGLADGTSRTFFIREDGKMVSSASTAAENSVSAMIVGVATRENYKKKGYATACMLKLCGQMLEEGKELCLFYDNPAAGAIYKRIGFEDIGIWMMYTYE
ncbi:GNAT family N-acetyltransferase [Ectobacillus antri]|uniref:GNAT family N-acetyltransferase n=1 Tax=Ectobacillus antri TaxID=2486280 RepID=A0ABT6H649_9BACI|nr:GNAT family N-acetyltransferase [Ectobacillus antri]MDG4657778.1 GNAT family N-acetyltransferase [Ectobacillus antri]MDG5754831.1 GNAT family N-acetyltransferase [Ectobacillus antri]